jgi:hypothetical protein
MSALVPLIYSRPESVDPSQINSETLLSLVSWVAFPVSKSNRLHHDEVVWVSKEYCDVEKSATSYTSLTTLADNDHNNPTHSRWIGNGFTPPRSSDELSTRKQSVGRKRLESIITDSGVSAAADPTIDPRAIH